MCKVIASFLSLLQMAAIKDAVLRVSCNMLLLRICQIRCIVVDGFLGFERWIKNRIYCQDWINETLDHMQLQQLGATLIYKIDELQLSDKQTLSLLLSTKYQCFRW